ncbi:precorrin-6A reductase [Carboxydothermus hydrogenoformans]|uniref:precorrin-6A reductase n=1 Tax=Carboxydothermus hydrogenoformans TaxID=129958 RepID=UPI000A025764|nr:precorrin-6A reductase [Carboxydothermus hydrogenoformans]
MVILLLGGTSESILIADLLEKKGLPFILSVASNLGLMRFKKYEKPLRAGVLDFHGLLEFVQKNGIKLIIDATHPFAKNASENAIRAAQVLNIPYIRFERPRDELKNSLIIEAIDLEAALRELPQLGKRPLITVGVKMLPEIIRKSAVLGQKPVVKVLPLTDNFTLLDGLGIPLEDRLSFWGPGSRELISQLIKFYSLTGLLTKESGDLGGEREKVESFLSQSLPVILIKRPEVFYPQSVSTLDRLEEILTLEAEKWKKQ